MNEDEMGRELGSIDLGMDADQAIDVVKALTGTSDLEEFIPEVWAREIERQAQPNRVMRNLQPQVVVNTDLLEAPGDIVHIAKLNDLTTGAIELTETVAIDPEAMSGSEITLTPTEYGAGIQISRKAQRRAYINTMNEATELLGRALAQKEDTEIIEKGIAGATQFVFTDPSYTSVNDILATDTLEPGTLRRARTLLRNQDAPGPYVVIIHPEQEGALLDDDQFIDASQYGSNEVVLNGEIGRWLGMRVIVTTNIPVNTNTQPVDYYSALILGERSLCIALKANPDFQEDYNVFARTTDIASVMEFDTSELNPDRYAVLYSA